MYKSQNRKRCVILYKKQYPIFIAFLESSDIKWFLEYKMPTHKKKKKQKSVQDKSNYISIWQNT